jgi:hypothetical protein
VLDVSKWRELTAEMLLSVVRENAEALLEIQAAQAVRSNGWPALTVPAASQLITAAPRLRLLHCDLECNPEEAPALLSNAHPFEALKIHTLDVRAAEGAFAVDAILAAAANHESLKHLCLQNADLSTAAALNSVVDLAIARRFYAVRLVQCRLPEAPLPALTRLINGGALTDFLVQSLPGYNHLADAQSVPAFFEALQRLRNVQLFHLQLNDHGPALLAALSQSARLTTLGLWNALLLSPEAQLAFGEGLAQLVATSATLHYLNINDCGLASEALTSLFAAISNSRSLQTLRCSGNDIDADCARNVVLPAVLRNTSLRTLEFEQLDIPELVEVEALVRARNR